MHQKTILIIIYFQNNWSHDSIVEPTYVLMGSPGNYHLLIIFTKIVLFSSHIRHDICLNKLFVIVIVIVVNIILMQVCTIKVLLLLLRCSSYLSITAHKSYAIPNNEYAYVYNVLFVVIRLLTLSTRRDLLCKAFFMQVSKPDHKLNYLLEKRHEPPYELRHNQKYKKRDPTYRTLQKQFYNAFTCTLSLSCVNIELMPRINAIYNKNLAICTSRYTYFITYILTSSLL